ncbi:MAG TPA: hypothetical protein VK524_09140 [Polyangiaceae bacterium]|nr:hypothetical protein [Polyangiaceae bacterium]
MRRSWLEREPGLFDVITQVGRLYRRAWQRPWVSLGLTLAAALLLVGISALRERTFAPRVVLRAIEADAQYGATPRPKRRLRDHVREAIFTNQRLLDVMEKHRLYASILSTNPQAALSSFRDDIDVEVYRNYFVEERSPNDPPRSARIAILYHSSDRQLALAVTRDLAALVADHESRTRRSQVEMLAREAAAQVERAQADVIQQQQAIVEKVTLIRADRDPQAVVELASLQRSLPLLERRVVEAETRKAQLDLNASLEAKELGLRFELVDNGAIAESAGVDSEDLLLFGLFTFVFGLPFLGLLAGAFDTRILEAEDLRRMGVPVLGQIRTSNSRAEGYA